MSQDLDELWRSSISTVPQWVGVLTVIRALEETLIDIENEKKREELEPWVEGIEINLPEAPVRISRKST